MRWQPALRLSAHIQYARQACVCRAASCSSPLACSESGVCYNMTDRRQTFHPFGMRTGRRTPKQMSSAMMIVSAPRRGCNRWAQFRRGCGGDVCVNV